MSRPWSLSRKVLVVASFITPKRTAPNLSPLFSRVDETDHAILTTVDGIADGVEAGRPWLAGRYFFCDDPSASLESASTSGPPAPSRRRRGRLVRAVLRLRGVRLLLGFVAETIESLATFSQTARFVRGGLRAVADAGSEVLLGISDRGPAIIATYVIAKLTRKPYVYYLVDLDRGNNHYGPERLPVRRGNIGSASSSIATTRRRSRKPSASFSATPRPGTNTSRTRASCIGAGTTPAWPPSGWCRS